MWKIKLKQHHFIFTHLFFVRIEMMSLPRHYQKYPSLFCRHFINIEVSILKKKKNRDMLLLFSSADLQSDDSALFALRRESDRFSICRNFPGSAECTPHSIMCRESQQRYFEISLYCWGLIAFKCLKLFPRWIAK